MQIIREINYFSLLDSIFSEFERIESNLKEIHDTRRSFSNRVLYRLFPGVKMSIDAEERKIAMFLHSYFTSVSLLLNGLDRRKVNRITKEDREFIIKTTLNSMSSYATVSSMLFGKPRFLCSFVDDLEFMDCETSFTDIDFSRGLLAVDFYQQVCCLNRCFFDHQNGCHINYDLFVDGLAATRLMKDIMIESFKGIDPIHNANHKESLKLMSDRIDRGCRSNLYQGSQPPVFYNFSVFKARIGGATFD